MFCVIAITFVPTQEDIKKLNTINTKEISLDMPESYKVAPLYKKDIYYRFVNESGDCVYILCEKNKYIYSGINSLSSTEIMEIFNKVFFRADKSYRLDNYTVSYVNGEQTKINGVSSYILEGTYSAEELTDLGKREVNKAFRSYIVPTRESICIFFFENDGYIFQNHDDAHKIMSSAAVFGTYFNNDTSSLPKKSGYTKTFKLDASDASRIYYAANTGNGARITRAFQGIFLVPIVLILILRRRGYLYIPEESPIRDYLPFKRKRDSSHN